MLENVKDEEFSILLDCLIEDNFIDEEDLNAIIYYEDNDNSKIEDSLHFNSDIMVCKHPVEKYRKEIGEALLISFRLDYCSYMVAWFMKTMVETGLEFYISEGYVLTEDDNIKFEPDLTEKERDVIKKPFVSKLENKEEISDETN